MDGVRVSCISLLLLLLIAGCDRGTRPQMIGRRAPDFAVQDSDRSVKLDQLEGGKVVVLNFWATWCPPCVDEIPSLAAMQSLMQDRVQVFAVSVDEDPEAYHRFLQEHGIHFLTVRDPDQNANHLYGTIKFPESYIIDRNGIVRRKFVGPVDWTNPEILSYLRSL